MRQAERECADREETERRSTRSATACTYENLQCLGSSRVKYKCGKHPPRWKDPHGSWQEQKKNHEKREAFRGHARDRSDKMKETRAKRGLQKTVSHKVQAIVDDPGWRPCQVPISDRNTPKERERACFSPMLSRARASNGPAPQFALARARRADVLACVICPGGHRTSRSGSPALARLLAQHDSN